MEGKKNFNTGWIWPSLAVSLLLLFGLRDGAVALVGSSCGWGGDGEMPRDNSKCLGKHI